ncbi:TIGR04219 family outer membrane beta-barrel protein [Thalassotalea sp. PLHSN55]|uniref:TIGR04219 family outer membrane beta-barrel protein n=1 Tax=Thalassotalea sp. PLHSN55 TaxID=3435888 RepID=UPI003F84CD4F
MKKMVLAVTISTVFTFTPQAYANFSYTPKKNTKVGLYIGGQIWQSKANGTVGEENTLSNFNLKKEQQNNYFVAIIHPISFLPNIRISGNTLDTTGKKNLIQEFIFGGETFSTGDDINTSFNVSYVDYSLYYQLLDNRKFSFDLGLTARDLNGAVTVTGATVVVDNEDDCPDIPQSNICPSPAGTYTPTGKIKADDIVPMLYIASDLSLPLKGVRVFAQGDFSLINDHTLSDYQVGVNYDLANTRMGNFNLTLGYKVVKMEFEDLNNLYTNIEFKGTFVGFVAHF